MKIIYDLFPSHFAIASEGTFPDVHSLSSKPTTKPATYVATTRVIVTDDVVVVAADAPNGAQIIFQEKYVLFEKSDKSALDSYVVTESGKQIAFKKDTNCGCGSRLRSWNPYRTLNSTKNPTE